MTEMPHDPASQRTATRATLSKEWIANQVLLDWMSAPNAPNWVNKLVTDKDLPEGHWALYALQKHVIPLLSSLQAQGDLPKKLSMVSLGCGSAHIEESLIRDFRWPIAELCGLEFDLDLRAAAKHRFEAYQHICSSFEFYDFNKSVLRN